MIFQNNTFIHHFWCILHPNFFTEIYYIQNNKKESDNGKVLSSSWHFPELAKQNSLKIQQSTEWLAPIGFFKHDSHF